MANTVNIAQAPNPGPFPNSQTYSITFGGTGTSGNVRTTSGVQTYSLHCYGGSSGTNTIQLLGSNDGTNFTQLGSNVTVANAASVTFFANQPMAYLQIKCTAWAASTTAVLLF